jgi:hypothetical protein
VIDVTTDPAPELLDEPDGLPASRHFMWRLSLHFEIFLLLADIKYDKVHVDILVTDERANPSQGGGAKSWICAVRADRQTAEGFLILLAVLLNEKPSGQEFPAHTVRSQVSV